jgi:hypothetical protein
MNFWKTSRRSSVLREAVLAAFGRGFSTFQRAPPCPCALPRKSSRTPQRQSKKNTNATRMVTNGNIPISRCNDRTLSARPPVGLLILMLSRDRTEDPGRQTAAHLRLDPIRLAGVEIDRASRQEEKSPLGGSSGWRKKIAAVLHRRSAANVLRRRPVATKGPALDTLQNRLSVLSRHVVRRSEVIIAPAVSGRTYKHLSTSHPAPASRSMSLEENCADSVGHRLALGVSGHDLDCIGRGHAEAELRRPGDLLEAEDPAVGDLGCRPIHPQ